MLKDFESCSHHPKEASAQGQTDLREACAATLDFERRSSLDITPELSKSDIKKLKKGEFPDKLIHGLQLELSTTPLGIRFQSLLSSVFTAICPPAVVDQDKIPIRFLYSHSEHVSACVLRHAKPITMVFGRNFLSGTTSVDQSKIDLFKTLGAYVDFIPESGVERICNKPTELFGVAFHELLHAIRTHHLGDIANSKLEETAADLLGIGLLARIGHNPEYFLWAIQKLYASSSSFSDGTISQYLDPHPGLINREDLIRSAIGYFFPIYRGFQHERLAADAPIRRLIEGAEGLEQVVSAIQDPMVSNYERFLAYREYVDPNVLEVLSGMQLDQKKFRCNFYDQVDDIVKTDYSNEKKLDALCSLTRESKLFINELAYAVREAVTIFKGCEREREVDRDYLKFGLRIIKELAIADDPERVRGLASLYSKWRSAAPEEEAFFDKPTNSITISLSDFCDAAINSKNGKELELIRAATSLVDRLREAKNFNTDLGRLFLKYVSSDCLDYDDIRDLVPLARLKKISPIVAEALCLTGVGYIPAIRKLVSKDSDLANLAVKNSIVTVGSAKLSDKASDIELKDNGLRQSLIENGKRHELDDIDSSNEPEEEESSKKKTKFTSRLGQLNDKIDALYVEVSEICKSELTDESKARLNLISRTLSDIPIDPVGTKVLEVFTGEAFKGTYDLINGSGVGDCVATELLDSGDVITFLRLNCRNFFYGEDYLGNTEILCASLKKLIDKNGISAEADLVSLSKAQREVRSVIRSILGLEGRKSIKYFPLTLQFEGYEKSQTQDLPHFRFICDVPPSIISPLEKLALLDKAFVGNVLWEELVREPGEIEEVITIESAADVVKVAHQGGLLPFDEISTWDRAIEALRVAHKDPKHPILLEAILIRTGELGEDLSAKQMAILLNEFPKLSSNQHLNSTFLAIPIKGSGEFEKTAANAPIKDVAFVWNVFQSHRILTREGQQSALTSLLDRVQNLPDRERLGIVIALLEGERIQDYQTRNKVVSLLGESVSACMNGKSPLSTKEQKKLISEMIRDINPQELIAVLASFCRNIPIQIEEARFLRKELAINQAKSLQRKAVLMGSFAEFLIDVRKDLLIEDTYSSDGTASYDERPGLKKVQANKLSYQVIRFLLSPYSTKSSEELLSVVSNLSKALEIELRKTFEEHWFGYGKLDSLQTKIDVIRYAFLSEDKTKNKKVAHIRHTVLSELKSLHDDFTNASNFQRAVLVREILFPDKRDLSSMQKALTPILKCFLPEQTNESDYLRNFLSIYISNLDMRQRDFAVAAILAAAQDSDSQAHSGPEAFVKFLEDLSALEIKGGQRGCNFPKVPREYRTALRRLTDKAKENNLWEVLDWVESVQPELEKQYNQYLRERGELLPGQAINLVSTGAVLGSASMCVTIEVTFSNGKSCVLSILRPYTRERAEYSADVLKNSLMQLPVKDRGRSVGVRILDSTVRRLGLEVDFLKTKDQVEIGSSNYEDSDVLIDDARVRFKVPEIYAQGKILGDDWIEYQFALMEKLEGVPFSKWEASEEKKYQAALGCLVKKARNIAAGHFCSDRNPGNTLFTEDQVGQIDFKALSLTGATVEDYQQFIRLLLTTAEKFETVSVPLSLESMIDTFLDAQDDLESKNEQIRPFVTEVQEAILSLNHLIEEVSTDDLMSALFSGLLQGAGVEFRTALANEYDNLSQFFKKKGFEAPELAFVQPFIMNMAGEELAGFLIKPPYRFFKLESRNRESK